MTLEQFLAGLSQIFLLVVTISTLFNWARYRDRTRRDIALVFVSLTATIILEDIQGLIGVEYPWLLKLGPLAVISHPYFLLRLAQYFRPVNKAFQRVALVGLLISWVVLLAFRDSGSLAASAYVFTYFAVVEVYAASILIQGALTIPGITGKRLQLVSVGSGLLAFLFVVAIALVIYIQLAGAASISPTLQSGFTSVLQFFLILSGLAYYLGFSPPRGLRRFWQLSELHLFLDRTSRQVTTDRSLTFEELSTAALRTVGGATAVIAVCDADGTRLRIELAGDPPLQVDNLEASADAISRAWESQKGHAVQLPKDIRPQIRRWADGFNVRSLYIVPMKSTLRPWGLLIVALSYDPLFPQDDLQLLGLLTEQIAIQLDHAALNHQLQNINQSLEQRVVERTLLLEKTNRDLETQINQRKQAEAQIAYQSYLLENVNDAVIGSDQNSMIRFWNSGAETIYGWTAAEVLGKSGRDLLRSEFIHSNREEVMHQLAERGIWKGESIQYRKDETPIIMESNSITLRNAAGEITGYVSVSRDVTARKQAEEEILRLNLELEERVARRTAQLEQTSAFLNSVIENIPIMIFVKRASDLTFERLNKAAEDLIGVPRDSLLGKNDYHFFPKEDADFFTSKDRQVLAGKETLDIPDEVLQTAHQGIRHLHTRKVPILGVDGKSEYLLGISEDITERQKAEENIRKLNQDLELRAAQLEASNKELETFSYSVSHDLRSPLRSIDGYSQILLEDYSQQIPPEGRVHLERVRASAQRMSEIIDDLLNLARVSKSAVQPEQINLSEMVEDITSELKRQNPQRVLAISITPSLEVAADPRLMRIVLENLLNNAWKFTAKKEQTVIEFGRKNQDGKPAFFIRDNGAGFDMAYAQKLFGVFQRLHSVTEFPGTGIGLATVQRIIKIHGGEIWAEGKEGEGAAFYFTL